VRIQHDATLNIPGLEKQERRQHHPCLPSPATGMRGTASAPHPLDTGCGHADSHATYTSTGWSVTPVHRTRQAEDREMVSSPHPTSIGPFIHILFFSPLHWELLSVLNTVISTCFIASVLKNLKVSLFHNSYKNNRPLSSSPEQSRAYS